MSTVLGVIRVRTRSIVDEARRRKAQAETARERAEFWRRHDQNMAALVKAPAVKGIESAFPGCRQLTSLIGPANGERVCARVYSGQQNPQCGQCKYGKPAIVVETFR